MNAQKSQARPINWIKPDQWVIVLGSKAFCKDGIFSSQVQEQSRVRENFRHVLVAGVKPLRFWRRGFTLIELLVVT